MVLLALPPTMDSPPEFCFCGGKTVESHDFWFCSTQCARQDALRSLSSPECHYRNVVRDAYVRAGAPELQPRRRASDDHLRSGPSNRHGFANEPPPFIPFILPAELEQANKMLEKMRVMEENLEAYGYITASKKRPTAEELLTEKYNRSRWEDIHWQPKGALSRPLRRAPSSTDVLKNNSKKSTMSTLLNLGRFRKEKDADTIAPPGRKDVRKGGFF